MESQGVRGSIPRQEMVGRSRGPQDRPSFLLSTKLESVKGIRQGAALQAGVKVEEIRWQQEGRLRPGSLPAER